MTKAYFSPSNLCFFPEQWKSDGTYTEDNWLSDAILLTEEMTAEFWKITPPAGKQIGSVDGLPAWVDIPPLTHEQLVSQAEQNRGKLRAKADSEIAWLSDASDAGIATQTEKNRLAAWKIYRVLLMRINPDDALAIEWPPVPDGVADVEV